VVIAPQASGSGPRSAKTPSGKSRAVPDSAPSTSDEWYAQGKEPTIDVDVEIIDRRSDSGRRRVEKTRIVPRFEEPVRDSGGIWVWVALAIGASAFIVGAGFYWQRLQKDKQQQETLEQVQQQQQLQVPQQPVLPPGAVPIAPPQPVAPPGPAPIAPPPVTPGVVPPSPFPAPPPPVSSPP
jgi:hypothetical protein